MANEPGQTLSRAQQLKIGETSRTVRNSLSAADRIDLWKFNLKRNSSFNLGLTGLTRSANVRLALLNSAGRVIQTTNSSSNQPTAFTNLLLTAGNFYIRVNLRSKDATRYALSFSAPATSDQFGNSFQTATPLRSATGNLSDFVGNSDPTDFVQFAPLVSGQLALTLSGLSNNASIELYDGSQNLLVTGTGDASSLNQTLNQQLTGIAGSTYYLRVAQAPGQDTSYQLDYSFTATPPQQTASGLRYIDLAVGTGATPTTDQTVTVQYTGILFNGFKFDSSRDRNQPFTFKIGTGQVIQGWDEGISTMRVGGRRQLIIPSALAYGSQAVGTIPANSNLIFDVELLSIG
jgi:FKBP-type peptidyl-prolyl cis-trans isomerase